MTNQRRREPEGRLLDLARSVLGDSVAGLVGTEVHVGDVAVQIDQLRFSNATTEVLPHLERLAQHAADAATAGPFDPLRLLKTGLTAMADSLDSARDAALLAQHQFREAATGRISIGTDLFGQSSRVIAPQVELDQLTVTCPTLWLHLGSLAKTPTTSPTAAMLDLEFDEVSLTAHVAYEALLRVIATQLPSSLHSIRDTAPAITNSPLAIAGRRLTARIRLPLNLTVNGPAVVAEISTLAIGRQLVRLPSRFHRRHVFEPLGPSATLTSATFDGTGLAVEATLAPIRSQFDARRFKAMLASSSSSPRSTMTW